MKQDMLTKETHYGDINTWVMGILLLQLDIFRSKITSYSINYTHLTNAHSRNNKMKLRENCGIDNIKMTSLIRTTFLGLDTIYYKNNMKVKIKNINWGDLNKTDVVGIFLNETNYVSERHWLRGPEHIRYGDSFTSLANVQIKDYVVLNQVYPFKQNT